MAGAIRVGSREGITTWEERLEYDGLFMSCPAFCIFAAGPGTTRDPNDLQEMLFISQHTDNRVHSVTYIGPSQENVDRASSTTSTTQGLESVVIVKCLTPKFLYHNHCTRLPRRTCPNPGAMLHRKRWKLRVFGRIWVKPREALVFWALSFWHRSICPLSWKDTAFGSLWYTALRNGVFEPAQLDRCIWNYQTSWNCRKDFDCARVRVHHKPTQDIFCIIWDIWDYWLLFIKCLSMLEQCPVMPNVKRHYIVALYRWTI